jgi:hypothetical protein
MRVNNYDIPAVFLTNAVLQKFREVEEFIDQESRDFNPYRVPLTANDILQACKERFGLKACCNLEFNIH